MYIVCYVYHMYIMYIKKQQQQNIHGGYATHLDQSCNNCFTVIRTKDYNKINFSSTYRISRSKKIINRVVITQEDMLVAES